MGDSGQGPSPMPSRAKVATSYSKDKIESVGFTERDVGVGQGAPSMLTSYSAHSKSARARCASDKPKRPASYWAARKSGKAAAASGKVGAEGGWAS